MKNLLIFLFGAACGVGGTLIFLRRDIQKRIAEMQKKEEIPFEVGGDDSVVVAKQETDRENVKKEYERKEPAPVVTNREMKIAYNNLDSNMNEEENDVNDLYNDEEKPNWESVDPGEMDDPGYETDCFVYFESDGVLSTESGTVIEDGYHLIGPDWKASVGLYERKTAYIRNNRTATIYQIFVEPGSYADEFGIDDYPKED